MIVSFEKLEQLSGDTRFRPEILEKIMHLVPLIRTSVSPIFWDALADRIRKHPGLEWKALNVLKRKGC